MTRDEVRAETDAEIDAAVKTGNELKRDPFEIGMVHTVFRPYCHMLDDAQALELDVNEVGKHVAALAGNLIKVFVQRTVPRDEPDVAAEVANSMMEYMAKGLTTDLSAYYVKPKPN